MSSNDLQRRLGYQFGQPALLRQALTHRSHGQPHNERLEFLGDSVLNCVISELLYARFGGGNEGELSRIRADLVRQERLREIAESLELGACLMLGEGEARSGGINRPSILADALEALLGAVFLDGGFERARALISGLYVPLLAGIDPDRHAKDAKTLLQEYLQGRRLPLPVYAVIGTSGAAHSQTFEVDCVIDSLSVRSRGTGLSRRAAEQAAATRALAQAREAAPAEGERKRRGPASRRREGQGGTGGSQPEVGDDQPKAHAAETVRAAGR
jgi:ribonuclease-3